MYGPYVSRGRRVLRVVLLLACVLLGTVFAITGLAVISLLGPTLFGLVATIVGVGLIVLAFLKHDRWHVVQDRLR